jgi:hypothetical protein
MKIRIVDKSLGMSGNNISFYDEEFFSLKPNESIIQIGNGKNNGTIRTDKFSYPIKYVGSIFIQFNKKEKCLLFYCQIKLIMKVSICFTEQLVAIFTEAVFSNKDRITGKTTAYLRFFAPNFIRTKKIKIKY